jgi:hypothetical protein
MEYFPEALFESLSLIGVPDYDKSFACPKGPGVPIEKSSAYCMDALNPFLISYSMADEPCPLSPW